MRWLPVLRARAAGRAVHIHRGARPLAPFLAGRDEAGRELPLDDLLAARLRVA